MTDVMDLTATIVVAHVSHHPIKASEIPGLIKEVHHALTNVAKPADSERVKSPAVPVKNSVLDDRVVCLECGKGFRVLKRHLEREHGLTAEQYRERFALPHHYPLVAPEYAKARSVIAKRVGLGRVDRSLKVRSARRAQ